MGNAGIQYGGAYIAMGSRNMNMDYVYAWPTAQIAVLGAEGATTILYKKEIAAKPVEEREEFHKQKIEEYTKKYLNAYIAVQEGFVDEIINPNHMRKRLYDDIISLADKDTFARLQKKHGNIPL